MILCIVGLPGSGKTQVARYLKKKRFFRISLGDFIRKELSDKKLKRTKKIDSLISLFFHRVGKDVLLAKQSVDFLKKTKYKNAIIDGCRDMREVNYIKKHMNDVYLVAVTCPTKLRYARQKGRKRFKTLTNEYLRERDEREISYGVKKLISKADYTIDNRGTMQQFEQKIDTLIKKIE